ncbi:hypothetical protein PFICI_04418 [Pestalotiopsis fici W106-1]|uniref:Nucleoside phosphorylase domain-containing protein n=1 Tax=Pestalotiopsis fici (strain W106-1 / CGMCC3.15140) TaxID=1229662 RepID=W3XAS7_PESFW|nr:uncharacterized protein PFICI_04418 [Pestalotiopsis fici W106-1]ETS82542.1 hypothetical protein PFICI_04418 [Pestalotiopsis fici W106-1]
MAGEKQPACREDFRVGILCALSLEFDAVSLLFDRFWDEDGDPYGKAPGDPNQYTTGTIGKHDVVLVLLPGMGKASAAGAAASFRSSYSRLELVFLVGICGGVPGAGTSEVILGDVVISKRIVQYDFGRQYPTEFKTKDTIEDGSRKPGRAIHNLVAVFETELGRGRLRGKASGHLKDIQAAAVRDGRQADYLYPGSAEDKLFAPTYVHRHYKECNLCGEGPCPEAIQSCCAELGCKEDHLVVRARLDKKRDMAPEQAQAPAIFVGRIGSGDAVMKSGAHRDALAKQHQLIAFEMEAAGAWEEVPCIVIKGICDYADSHKNKRWQDFAAITAAAVTKAVLGRYDPSDSGILAENVLSQALSAPQNHNTISNNNFGNGTRIHFGDVHSVGSTWSGFA